MERVRKSKTKPTLESVLFSTPEQKLLRFLLSEPTTAFTPRVLSSRLKGVRGLGGVEGIMKILKNLHEIGLVQFVNNNREVCIENDAWVIQLMKTMSAICDLEGLKDLLQPHSTHGILFGSRAKGRSTSDSDYNLLIVSNVPSDVENIVTKHPLGKKVSLVVKSSEEYLQLPKRDQELSDRLEQGITMWGSNW